VKVENEGLLRPVLVFFSLVLFKRMTVRRAQEGTIEERRKKRRKRKGAKLRTQEIKRDREWGERLKNPKLRQVGNSKRNRTSQGSEIKLGPSQTLSDPHEVIKYGRYPSRAHSKFIGAFHSL
jgi:hypothetical protein